MVVSSRAIAALGLGLAGLGLLVLPAVGQQPSDNAVRRSASAAAAPNNSPKPPDPAVVGWLDLTAVFKGYKKFKVQGEEFKAAAQAKQAELMKYQAEAQQEAQMLAKMTPGSVDYKKHEDNITKLKAQMEAGRESAEREFSMREAEMFSLIYKDIASMTGRVARHRGMTFVLKVNTDPPSSANPNMAMAAMDKDVIYADKSLDITSDVLFYLNREYEAAGGGSKPGATTAAPAPAAPRGN